MTAEPAEPSQPRSFKEASPREIRAALIPEEQVDFDVTWQAAMTEAAQTLDLSEVFRTLDSWRTHAEITTDLGHAGYRQWLARAERIALAGETPPGMVPLDDIKALLDERLAP